MFAQLVHEELVLVGTRAVLSISNKYQSAFTIVFSLAHCTVGNDPDMGKKMDFA